jgi:hypothetical protein
MFARLETNVSLLGQRAGSPPTATEFVRRNIDNGDSSGVMSALVGLEFWIGDLLESHLSYPALSYFRSQHERARNVKNLLSIQRISDGQVFRATSATVQAGMAKMQGRTTDASGEPLEAEGSAG